MTTIAYCSKTKQIAIDSRVTGGDQIHSDEYEKFADVGHGIWFFSGSVLDYTLIMNEVGKPSVGRVEASDQIADYAALYCSEQSVYSIYNSDGKHCVELLQFSDACGTGTPYALTALDMGATAKQAVEMAMRRDTKTGGKVHVFDCQLMGFVE